MFIYLLAIVIVFLIVKNRQSKKNSEMTNGISFLILNIPTGLLLMKLEKQWLLYERMPSFLGVAIYIILGIFISSIFYVIIRKLIKSKIIMQNN